MLPFRRWGSLFSRGHAIGTTPAKCVPGHLFNELRRVFFTLVSPVGPQQFPWHFSDHLSRVAFNYLWICWLSVPIYWSDGNGAPFAVYYFGSAAAAGSITWINYITNALKLPAALLLMGCIYWSVSTNGRAVSYQRLSTRRAVSYR